MSDLFNLGNYASYILSAMGIALVLMILEPMLLIMKRRSIIKELKQAKRLDERREREAHS